MGFGPGLKDRLFVTSVYLTGFSDGSRSVAHELVRGVMVDQELRGRYEISGACIPHQSTSLRIINDTDLSVTIPAVVPRGRHLILVVYVCRRYFLESHEFAAFQVC